MTTIIPSKDKLAAMQNDLAITRINVDKEEKEIKFLAPTHERDLELLDMDKLRLEAEKDNLLSRDEGVTVTTYDKTILDLDVREIVNKLQILELDRSKLELQHTADVKLAYLYLEANQTELASLERTVNGMITEYGTK